MKTTIIVIVGILLSWSKVMAGEAGLGIALSDYDTTIYAPIQIGETIKLTPFANYYSLKRSDDSLNQFNRKRFELGLGVFKSFPMQYDTFFYFGFRLGYAEVSDSRVRNLFDGTTSRDEKKRGYVFSPTMGFEYHINTPISISAEIDWTFQNLKGETIDSDLGTGDTRDKRNFTATRVVFTYYFN